MKDVIYIDIEDDITSIIEKVKTAKAQVVALVPPKRAGALQSVVNLKLLQRTATSNDKRLVLITADRSLTSLASGVQIPVAKNLQSKPELAPVAEEPTEDDEIISGDSLPIGEHAKTAPKTPEELEELDSARALADIEKDNTPPTDKKNRKTPKGMKVPDFGRFRKWLFIGGGVGVVLIIFLIWAIFFAPRATVTITAKTSPSEVNIPVVLTMDGQTNIDSKTLRPDVQEKKDTQTVEFQATGQKDVGDRAKGSMTLRNAADSDSISVPAGTRFSSGDYTFTSDSAVTVPGARVAGGTIVAGTATVNVTAANIGADYNVPARNYNTEVSGIAARGGNMSGGSKRTIKIVSDGDVAAAKEKVTKTNEAAIKDELRKKFKKATIIEESYTAAAGDPQVSPGVGEEATSAKLTVETTYKLLGLKEADLKRLLDETLAQEIEGRQDQRVYDNGQKKVQFESYEQAEGGNNSVQLKTVGQIGPKIEDKKLAKEIEGLRYGEIQQKVEAIRGVESVNTEFWPFWVTRAPSEDKVKIEFDLKNGQ